MIVDSLAFVGESLFGWSATADELLARMDEAEIDHAVVCPPKPPGYHLAAANVAVASAVAAHPDRLTGFARVDPNLGEAACQELDSALGELGLAGLFLHPWEETFRAGAPLVDAVLETARRHGAPVVVAAGYPWLSEAPQVGELARRFPDLTVVATNGAQINISGLGQEDAERALAAHPNLSIQTAGVYREDFIEGVVSRIGPKRVLFASGFPLFDPRLEILRVRWAPGIDERQRALLLGGNAARLLLG